MSLTQILGKRGRFEIGSSVCQYQAARMQNITQALKSSSHASSDCQNERSTPHLSPFLAVFNAKWQENPGFPSVKGWPEPAKRILTTTQENSMEGEASEVSNETA